MSSLLSSGGLALATAMAVSGTVLLLAFNRHKPLPLTHLPVDPNSRQSASNLRSCMASGERKSRRKKKKVRFADSLVEAAELASYEDGMETGDDFINGPPEKKVYHRRMPPNRAALYSGILQDRLQRMACSY